MKADLQSLYPLDTLIEASQSIQGFIYKIMNAPGCGTLLTIDWPTPLAACIMYHIRDIERPHWPEPQGLKGGPKTAACLLR